MSTRTIRTLSLPVAALLLGACDDRFEAGPTRTETREVDNFDAIHMTGTARLEITVGEKESLSVEGGDAAIERMQTDVRGDTLYVRNTQGNKWIWGGGGQGVTVRVSVPHLTVLKLEGGNDVRLTGFDGGESTLEVEGATHIEAQGRLDNLIVHMVGAGHADLTELVANDAKVSVDGVGSVHVNPKESLDATMNGVGAILYTGVPRELKTKMNGLGTIGQQGQQGAEKEERKRWKPDPDRGSPAETPEVI